MEWNIRDRMTDFNELARDKLRAIHGSDAVPYSPDVQAEIDKLKKENDTLRDDFKSFISCVRQWLREGNSLECLEQICDEASDCAK